MKGCTVIVCLATAAAVASAGYNYYSAYASGNYQQLMTNGTVMFHSLVSSQPDVMQRVVLATPAQNSGSVIQFVSQDASSTTPFQVTAQQAAGNFSTSLLDVQSCATQIISINGPAVMANFALGGVRTVRDFVEPSSPVIHDDIKYLQAVTTNLVSVNRLYYDNVTYYAMNISGAGITFKGDKHTDGICVSGADLPDCLTVNGLQNVTVISGSYPAQLTIKACTNAVQLTPYTVDTLLDPMFPGDIRNSPYANQLSFVAYQEKFVAGSWRFLTYFGRDTLITGYLMYDQLSTQAINSILTGAIERIDTTGTAYTDCNGKTCNSKGMVCHEETIGDYSGWLRSQNGAISHDDSMQCDYKMVDTDFLVLPLLYRHFLNKGNMNMTNFLQSTVPADFAINAGQNFGDLLQANVDHIVALAKPFYTTGHFSDLVAIRHPTVGNWRDSDIGLAGGMYPFDVNVGLVPSALHAIVMLANQSIISNAYYSQVLPIMEYWEQHALTPFLKTNPNVDAFNERIESYASAMNYEAGVDNSNNVDLPQNIYALSILADGRQVQFGHTDIGAVLYYRNDSSVPDWMANDFAIMCKTDFPRGLYIPNVGLVVTNPGYGWGQPESQTYAGQLDQTEYHGTVVWEWQQIQAYLALQKWYLNDDTDRSIKNNVGDAMNRIFGMMQDHVGTEVYSYYYNTTDGSGNAADLNVVAGGGTEADLVQLWSYAGLGLVNTASSGVLAMMTVGLGSVLAALAFLL